VLIGPPLLQASIFFILFFACEFISPLLLASKKAQRRTKIFELPFSVEKGFRRVWSTASVAWIFF
jgi:hypothetical protein